MPIPADRYAAMHERCPFAVAAPTAAPIAQQPSFAANWYVSGIARVGDVDFVTVEARDLSSQFTLYGRESNPQNQVALVSVEWIDGIGKSVVTIRKGGETAKLGFNEAQVHGPVQSIAVTGASGAGKPLAPSGTTASMAAGAKPIAIRGFNGSPRRTLKIVKPPTNLSTPLPTGGAAVRSSYQPPGAVIRSRSPVIRRPIGSSID